MAEATKCERRGGLSALFKQEVEANFFLFRGSVIHDCLQASLESSDFADFEQVLDAAAEIGRAVSYSGPPAMPTFLFADDPDIALGRRFSRAAAERGALLHPLLNWNLSGAHTPADIDETIAIVRDAMAAM